MPAGYSGLTVYFFVNSGQLLSNKSSVMKNTMKVIAGNLLSCQTEHAP